MTSEARWGALLAIVVASPAVAFAQTTAPGSGGDSPPAAASASPTDSAAATGSVGPVFPATGYGWTEHHTKSRKAGAVRPKANAPEVILPGFETLADGSTRLFVELSKPVSFDTKAASGSITYVLKGAHVGKRNNYNPLVTVHFNTPVTVAKLLPHGSDLYFVVDLRAHVQPTATLEAAKDGSAILKIEFPKGDYLLPEKDEPVPGPPTTMGASSSPTPAPATTAPLPHGGARGGHRHSH